MTHVCPAGGRRGWFLVMGGGGKRWQRMTCFPCLVSSGHHGLALSLGYLKMAVWGGEEQPSWSLQGPQPLWGWRLLASSPLPHSQFASLCKRVSSLGHRWLAPPQALPPVGILSSPSLRADQRARLGCSLLSAQEQMILLLLMMKPRREGERDVQVPGKSWAF